MEKILIYNDGEVQLQREELELIPEFKELLSLAYNKQEGDRDGRKRLRAFKEFTYMWFTHSYNSPYREYDDKERRTEALATAQLPETYEFSTAYQLAEKKYLALTETRILKLIKAAEKAVDNLRAFLETVDFTLTTDNGNLKYKPSEVIRVISELDKVSEGLETLADRQKREKKEFSSTRGAQEAGWLMEQDKFKPKTDGNSNRNNAATETESELQ